jgi:hypothetical protein
MISEISGTPVNLGAWRLALAGSMLFDFNDSTDLPSNLKSNVLKDIICQGDHEAQPPQAVHVPRWHDFEKTQDDAHQAENIFPIHLQFWALRYKCSFLCFFKSRLWDSWYLAVQLVSIYFSIRDNKDYEMIVAHFPYLVGVAYWLGYVDPEVRGATESKAFHRNSHKELGSGSLELLQCVASA